MVHVSTASSLEWIQKCAQCSKGWCRECTMQVPTMVRQSVPPVRRYFEDIQNRAGDGCVQRDTHTLTLQTCQLCQNTTVSPHIPPHVSGLVEHSLDKLSASRPHTCKPLSLQPDSPSLDEFSKNPRTRFENNKSCTRHVPCSTGVMQAPFPKSRSALCPCSTRYSSSSGRY